MQVYSNHLLFPSYTEKMLQYSRATFSEYNPLVNRLHAIVNLLAIPVGLIEATIRVFSILFLSFSSLYVTSHHYSQKIQPVFDDALWAFSDSIMHAGLGVFSALDTLVWGAKYMIKEERIPSMLNEEES